MRILKSTVTRTVELEFNQGELDDLHKARDMFRQTAADPDLDLNLAKALENAIYLISTVLGNHQ
jgi:hypothetical protein